MPKTTRKKNKKMTYQQMLKDILKPKKSDSDKQDPLKTITGLGGGKFQKLERI